MKTTNLVLSVSQFETVKKVLRLDGLALEFDSYERSGNLCFVKVSDVMMLVISRVAWLYSYEFDHSELTGILELLGDYLHSSSSKVSVKKSNNIICKNK